MNSSQNRVLLMFALAATLMVSCNKSDSDPVSKTKYIVVSNSSNGNETYGTISVFTTPGNELKKDVYKTPFESRKFERIGDIVVNDGKLYVVRKEIDKIDILDLDNFKITGTISLGPSKLGGGQNRHVAAAAGKLIVSGSGYISPSFSKYAYLKKVDLNASNKIDSVSILKDGEIVALAASGNKIFASFLSDFGFDSPGIAVFDATTLAKISVINLPFYCSELHVNSDGNIVGLSPNTLLKINASTLSLTSKPLDAFGYSIPGATNGGTNSMFCLDTDKQIIYYLASAPQPASAPYVLKSLDLKNETTTALQTSFASGRTMSFDKKAGTFLIGDYNYNSAGTTSGIAEFGAVSTFDMKTGMLSKIFTIPAPPDQILVVN